jgi:hypothetical protein
MRAPTRIRLSVALWALCATALSAQDSTAKAKPPASKAPKAAAARADSSDVTAPKPKKVPNPRLFRSEAPLEVTLTLNVRQIKRDKTPEAPWRTASLRYTDADGKAVTVPVRVKTRGIWRLKHCDMPPLRFKVGDKVADGTLFANLDEPKLVTYCRDFDRYEQYVLQEAQLYRIYRLLTDVSHKVRLLKMTYADSATGKVEATRWSFLIEDPAQVAARVGGKIVPRKGATADDLDPAQSALAFTYLYFIANTDVSFSGLHNGEIIAMPDGRNVPVPYDFDFAGVINANYAGVDPSLPIRDVRTRLFRGYCAHAEAYPAAFDLFRAKRADIEALYADSLGTLISPGTVTRTLSYYGEFYDAVRTPEQARRRLLADCVR